MKCEKEYRKKAKYPLSFIQGGISQSSFHLVESHEGVVTVDSVNIADGDGREVNLEED